MARNRQVRRCFALGLGREGQDSGYVGRERLEGHADVLVLRAGCCLLVPPPKSPWLSLRSKTAASASEPGRLDSGPDFFLSDSNIGESVPNFHEQPSHVFRKAEIRAKKPKPKRLLKVSSWPSEPGSLSLAGQVYTLRNGQVFAYRLSTLTEWE